MATLDVQVMLCRHRLAWAALFATWCVATPSHAHANETFLLLDDIQQYDRPDTGFLGFTRLRAIPTAQLWERGRNRATPDIATAVQAAERHINSLNLVCLNVEHWSTSTDNLQDLNVNLSKYIQLAEAVKEAVPNARVGFYSMVPIREYYAPVRQNSVQLAKWRERNLRLRAFADAVDIVYPSLYAFDHDHDAWERYAIANIQEARLYDKPVIVFLWPQIHQSSRRHGLDFVSYEFWTHQLETALEHADGLVIWTKKTPFDSNAPWWRATVDFSERHGFASSVKSKPTSR